MSGDDVNSVHYVYDALNRLVRCRSKKFSEVNVFYKKNVRCTSVEGDVSRSVFNGGGYLLAQRDHLADCNSVTLLGSNVSHTVINSTSQQLDHIQPCLAYGFSAQGNADVQLPTFNGEYSDPATGHYLLGNGYRAYNPVLMRFNSPDSWSPFGAGGINSYGYCSGDPVNFVDPSGHALLASVFRGMRRFTQKRQFNAMYSQAPAAKQHIDEIAIGLAKKYRGTAIPAPLKGRDRAWEKVINDYGGDASKIKDIARNTLVVKRRNIGNVVNDLQGRGATIKVINSLPGDSGYRGVHATISTRSGLSAEIQIHTPSMVVANLPESVSRGALSAQTYSDINGFVTRNGYSSGKAHSLYEVIRDANQSIRAREKAASDLRDYFSFVNDGFVRL